MAGADWLDIEIAWGNTLEAMRVPRGVTIRGVTERARLAERWSGWNQAHQALGIHGRVLPPDTLVAAGDRVEVYSPLVADPKELRRRRLGRQA